MKHKIVFSAALLFLSPVFSQALEIKAPIAKCYFMLGNKGGTGGFTKYERSQSFVLERNKPSVFEMHGFKVTFKLLQSGCGGPSFPPSRIPCYAPNLRFGFEKDGFTSSAHVSLAENSVTSQSLEIEGAAFRGHAVCDFSW